MSLQILASATCAMCQSRKPSSFCDLPPEARAELDRVKQIRTFAPGERLLEEDKAVESLMIICEGTVVLTMSSSAGKELVVGFSERGDVLGLSSVLCSRPQAFSTSALDRTRVAVIHREDFMSFLHRFPAAALNATAELSREVNRTYDKIRLIGSGLSVSQRVASWLLDLEESQPHRGEFTTTGLTHEKIAQMLGVSRESVTRTLSSFKKRGAVEIRGIRIYVRDRMYLRSLLEGLEQPQSLTKVV